MTHDEILDRIRKVQAMVQQGAEGERQSAELRLAEMMIICSYLKFIEITTAYELYQKSYDKQKSAFIYAFLMRNRLLPEGKSDHTPTKEELEMLAQAMHMQASIEKVNTHKQLGTGRYLE